MKHTFRDTAFAATLALAAAGASASGNHTGGHSHDADDAIGKPGVATKSTRTINVDMADNMRFTPADISVKQGETVRFVIRNSGQIKHELVLGTEKELREHSEVMKKNPEMEHADANMITLAPGKSGEIVWQFTKAGEVDFACLQPGHYDAGMKGAVTVSNATGKTVSK
ncbi:cupredoxin family protein [Variovorax sp. PAMC28562]|uniref:cupredoxin domain-containing protein n=1 Tax=Variovorax sp. PAMC28562 TaxID=2762323 RepID=UPI00164D7007|nr:cupredoxin family protein [Variovorax sp. PAMC28562]QNK75001.1 cupredoxin family protein [Variovorax sp. PAMC28562]